MEQETRSTDTIFFETEPGRYVHWKLGFDGPVATLAMDVQEDKGLRPGYVLKLNSYDLSVDIELADAIQRIRFDHPEVRALVIRSAKDRVFCSGANIFMLGSSSHGFKVNFCKYTNETRLYLEDLSAESGVGTIAAIQGSCAGGGYELALACDRIALVDDGSATVSLPETPLLGVLPGTGGLTRVVDKRKVRRDLADVFSTVAEGVRGKRAEEWRLVDRAIPRSLFTEELEAEVHSLVARSTHSAGSESTDGRTAPSPPVSGSIGASGSAAGGPTLLPPLHGVYEPHRIQHRFVTLEIDADARIATLTVRGPAADEPTQIAAMRARGADLWALRAFREIDDVLLQLRFNHPTIGVVVLKTEGDPQTLRAVDHSLFDAAPEDRFAQEVIWHMKRVLRRVDVTARSFFALIEPGSCFAGSLFELALASDRSYMLDDPDHPVRIGLSPLNIEGLEMHSGWTRLHARFHGEPDRLESARSLETLFTPEEALDAELVTFTPDEIDWEDEVRIAIEERASLSPDALTGMEANLRFPGPETMATKIFGRLSAWQNWIFIRPNSTGETGALSLYGKPARPEFDWRRT